MGASLFVQPARHRSGDARRDAEKRLAVSGLAVELASTGKRLLNDISFSLSAGQNLGVAGPSGAGKTLLALAILGMLPPGIRRVSGEIRFNDLPVAEAIEDRPTELRGARISILFQEPRLSFNRLYSVGDQIVEPLTLRDAAPDSKQRFLAEASRVLADLGFSDPERIMSARPYELSSGQLQRCLLASSILCRPELLVVDEPTSSLDRDSTRLVVSALRELGAKRETSLLVVSHDSGLLDELTDNRIALVEGRIETPGPASRPARSLSHSSLSPQRTSSSPNLRVRDLRKAYQARGGGQHVVALSGVSFDLQPGEVLGIVGPSGAGKTTLAKVLMNLVHPDAGEIEFRGTRLTRRQTPQDICRLGMTLVWQDPYASLAPTRRIGEQILDALRQAKGSFEPRLALAETARWAELPEDLLCRYPRELSGGQAQRATIARAFAAQPTVLIADEPFAYLDPATKAIIASKLKAWCNRDGKSVLLITHNIDIVEYICERWIALELG
jgi:peptide/nickel transport system ATP-binding protein